MTVFTTFNPLESIIGGPHTINDTTRVNVAPENLKRLRVDAYFSGDIITHCVELYDALTGGNLIGILDREFTGVMIRDNTFYSMDKNAIYQGDIYAIIAIGATPYDINVTEYIG